MWTTTSDQTAAVTLIFASGHRQHLQPVAASSFSSSSVVFHSSCLPLSLVTPTYIRKWELIGCATTQTHSVGGLARRMSKTLKVKKPMRPGRHAWFKKKNESPDLQNSFECTVYVWLFISWCPLINNQPRRLGSRTKVQEKDSQQSIPLAPPSCSPSSSSSPTTEG